MDIILIPGMWLTGSAWAPITGRLKQLGHNPIPLAGAGEDSAVTTLEELTAAVVDAIDSADRPVVLGHSAAATLAWIAADRRPDQVSRVLMLGGFPESDGARYFNPFPAVDGKVAFPGWEPFEGPDSADLDAATRDRFVQESIAVPEGITHAPVQLTDDRRYEVPVTVICPEFSPAEAKEAVDGGHVPELSKAKRLDYVDLDSGHWPMFSRPAELAAVINSLLQ
ncbi:alpha/beta hydrolase [Microlunatus elymi]|uniref:Alpha/beta hydrolase n=1 Tax=Microlunatus elymi TaxID=2596828 RepID=A0A516Q4D2_9ACTN|nr:alpha/beta hydrolase [Microlunatus elymi]QDP98264.1 alpha/beta hydrolase [Microlunatus elymi]